MHGNFFMEEYYFDKKDQRKLNIGAIYEINIDFSIHRYLRGLFKQ